MVDRHSRGSHGRFSPGCVAVASWGRAGWPDFLRSERQGGGPREELGTREVIDLRVLNQWPVAGFPFAQQVPGPAQQAQGPVPVPAPSSSEGGYGADTTGSESPDEPSGLEKADPSSEGASDDKMPPLETGSSDENSDEEWRAILLPSMVDRAMEEMCRSWRNFEGPSVAPSYLRYGLPNPGRFAKARDGEELCRMI
jgi:hypothetical protein